MSYNSFQEALKENIALGVRKYLYTKYSEKYGEFNKWSKTIERQYREEFEKLYKESLAANLADSKT